MAKQILTESQKNTLEEIKTYLLDENAVPDEKFSDLIISLSNDGINVNDALTESFGIEL